MAAAGLTEMMHGTPEQVEAAASLTLQATIGWPCDPIPGGLCETPTGSRLKKEFQTWNAQSNS